MGEVLQRPMLAPGGNLEPIGTDGSAQASFQAKPLLHPPSCFPVPSPVSQRGLGSFGKLTHKAEFQERQAGRSPGCFLSSFLLLKGLQGRSLVP